MPTRAGYGSVPELASHGATQPSPPAVVTTPLVGAKQPPIAHERPVGIDGEAAPESTAIGAEPTMPLAGGLAGWSSWWSVMFFTWCEYLSTLCAERPLKMEDIWALDAQSASLYCLGLVKDEINRTGCVIRAFYRTQSGVLVFSGILTFLSSCCELVTPIAVFEVVDAAANGRMERVLSWGALWTAILLAARFLRSFLLHWADFILNYALLRTTNPLSILLLESVQSCRRGEHYNFGSEGATNLFATDMKNVGAMIKHFHRLWSVPLELIGLFYILHWVAGKAMLQILIVSSIMYLVIYLITLRETSLFRQWLSASDRRFAKLHDVFDNILGVKLYAWQDKALKRLEEIRDEEKQFLRRHLVFRTIRMSMTWVAPAFNLIATGVFLTHIPNNTLNAPALTFSAVAIFHAINDAFIELLKVLQIALEFDVSLDRIEKVVPVTCRSGGEPFVAKSDALLCGDVPQCKQDIVGQDCKSSDALVLLNASFSEPQAGVESRDLLHYLTLTVRIGEFVVVHGRVGGGKSLLLAAIAGLLPRTKGYRILHGSVAFCSQSPWVQSTSIRENILFGRPFEPTKYWNVLDACELTHDIKFLPDGDLTFIGSRSYVSLSTGQLARIALARACYADADVYILDSPLDSVDSIVQCDILLKCFGNLLQNKTIIMATHNPEVIRSEYVDRTIEMDKFELRWSTDTDAPVNSKVAEVFVSKRKRNLVQPVKLGRGRIKSEIVTGRSSKQVKVTQSSLLLSQCPPSVMFTHVQSHSLSTPSFPQQSRNFYRDCGWKSVLSEYFSYSRNPWKLVIVMLLHFITQVLATSSIYSFSRWMGVYGELYYEKNVQADDVFGGAMRIFHVYIALVCFSAIAFFMAAFATFAFSLAISDRLFRAMTISLLHARMPFFSETTVGKLLNRYCRDLHAVDASLQSAVFALLKTFFGCYCALFASLGWMSGHLLKANGGRHHYSELESVGLKPVSSSAFWILIMLMNLSLTSVIIGSFWYLGIKSNRPTSDLFVMHREALSPLFTVVSEAIAGKSVISAFGAAQRGRVSATYAKLADSLARISWAIWSFESWLAVRSLLVENILTSLLLLGLILLGHDANPYRPATIGLLLYLIFNMREDLKNMFMQWNMLEKDLVCLQRVFEYIHLESEVSSNPHLPPLSDPLWPHGGSVEFRHVDYAYAPYVCPGSQHVGGLEKGVILRNVSFQVESGERVGIVGRSGAGKSSLALALLRVNNPLHGSIYLDGIDITRVGLNILRSKVSYLPPSPVFCSGTLRDYLDPCQQTSDFDLWTTLDQAGLKESIRRMSSQLSTTIDEIVESWSNGERQLLCLARALRMQARVIFLDEATASTDQETDSNVQRVVCESLTPNMTLFCISHRLDSLLSFDKLIVLADGQVVGCGPVMDLVSSGDSEFSELLENSQLVY